MQIIPFSFRLYADRHGGREQWAEDDCEDAVADRPRRQTNKKEEDQPETGFALEVTSANFFLEVQGLLGKMPRPKKRRRRKTDRQHYTFGVWMCCFFKYIPRTIREWREKEE